MLISKPLQNDKTGHKSIVNKSVILAEKKLSILKSFVEEKRTKGMAARGLLKNLSKKSLCWSFWGQSVTKI